MEENDKGITVKKASDMPEWYTQCVLKSGLADYGPVQGTIAFMPYSYSIWEMVQDAFNKMIKDTGHSNTYFPMFIPESLIEKEAEHFEGFSPEVFWVTKAGSRDLNEKIAIRPTSETIIYYFMQRWIRSWKDLPLLLNQWCNVARAEIKATKPFLRTSEFLWQEGHTAHATRDEAEKEALMILGFYKRIIEDYLAIPVIIGKKSESEKFPGAVYTYTLEAMMPDGKAVQSGTSHYLGTNFSKPLGITFTGKDGSDEFIHTTSWGISTRLIGTLIMEHGDDKGLILPPMLAPIQVVIVPIYKSEEEMHKVLDFSEEVKAKLISAGIRAKLDDREDRSPGYKFNDWELRGVPVRLEVGPRELESKKLGVARRDTAEKSKVDYSEIVPRLSEVLTLVQNSIFDLAKARLEKMIFGVSDYDEFKRYVGKGFVRVNWCGSEKCEMKNKG
ncbi:proline--tRNA ligase [mine drainage metagenome]|uniref:Proline--tRNA ligase n=1 Tax=mine drainage metagenome TaxID=410659 RepID=T0ZC97_9ZZZZ